MWGLPSILFLFGNKFNKFDNTGAWMLDSIYHMTFKLFCNRVFRLKMSRFCQIYAGNCIQNFHLGKYKVGYRERSHKKLFPTIYPMIYLDKWKLWIWLSPFKFCACLLLKSLFHLKLENWRMASNKMWRNEVKLFTTVYHGYTAANF